VRYDILTLVNSKITAFRDVKQYSLIHTSISREPAGSNGVVLVEATCFSETLVLIYPITQQHIPEHYVTTIKSELCVTFL
jgi:hypothetical protein